MDTFVNLTDYLSTRDEPTILPSLRRPSADDGACGQRPFDGTIYQTRYLIWDNIGLAGEHKNITAYQAMADVFGKAGIHEGTMFNFQQTMQESEIIFMICRCCSMIFYTESTMSTDSRSLIPRRVLAMGVKNITLDSIETVDEDKGFIIHGKNFTQSECSDGK